MRRRLAKIRGDEKNAGNWVSLRDRGNSFQHESILFQIRNDIGTIRLKVAKPLAYDGYTTNRLTGSFILIEQGTNATVAAGMLAAPAEAVKPEYNDFAI